MGERIVLEGFTERDADIDLAEEIISALRQFAPGAEYILEDAATVDGAGYPARSVHFPNQDILIRFYEKLNLFPGVSFCYPENDRID